MSKSFVLFKIEGNTREVFYVEKLRRTGNEYTVIPVRAKRYYFLTAIYWACVFRLKWVHLRHATD